MGWDIILDLAGINKIEVQCVTFQSHYLAIRTLFSSPGDFDKNICILEWLRTPPLFFPRLPNLLEFWISTP